MRRLEKFNYYEILDISPAASLSEVREAYERAKRIYSHDSMAIYSLLDEDEIDEMSKLVEKAYATIGNEKERREYDRLLGQFEGEEQTEFEISFSEPTRPQAPPIPLDQTEEVPSPDQRKRINDIVNEPDFEFTGSALEEIREFLGLELGEISMRTKISTTNLSLMESENFAKLPPRVYLKGFVKEYAKYLGLDPVQVTEDYMNRYQEWWDSVEA
jgi:curved DNA-binding protein CbpA